MRKIDDLDIAIASALDADCRASNRQIARQLNVSEKTVRQRVSRMLEDGALSLSAQLSHKALKDLFLAIVGINLTGSPGEATKTISALPGTLFIVTVTGRYDLLAGIAVASRDMLAQIITKEIDHIEGVTNTETYVVLESIGANVDASKVANIYKDLVSL